MKNNDNNNNNLKKVKKKRTRELKVAFFNLNSPLLTRNVTFSKL